MKQADLMGIRRYPFNGSVGKEPACRRQEIQVRFLCQVDLLEEGTTTYSHILA